MTRMRGEDRGPETMFSYVSAEQRVPKEHPLRAIRALVDDVLRDMSREFDGVCPCGSAVDSAGAAPPSAAASDLQRKDGGAGGDGSDFRGQQRKNDTHASKTDPDARLYRKSNGAESRLAYLGHLLIENRHGLIADAMATTADGTAE